MAFEEALRFGLKTLALRGDDIAQWALGIALHKGLGGLERDDQLALTWHKRSARQGHALAQCTLGYMFDLGAGCRIDHQEAALLFMKSAEQGHAGAQVSKKFLYFSSAFSLLFSQIDSPP